MEGRSRPLLRKGVMGARSASCNPSSWLGGIVLVVMTFTCTRWVDHAWEEGGGGGAGKGSLKLVLHSGYKKFGSLEDALGEQAGWVGRTLSLRVYVYEEEEVEGLKKLVAGRDHSIQERRCEAGQWGTQVKIHRFLLSSEVRTRDKDKAHLFFVPAYIKCVRMAGGLSDKEISSTFVEVLQQMPYFRRSGGRDHVFVFPSGAGAHLFKEWAVFLNRSIFLTPEGDRTDKRGTSAFNTWKDIIIPGNVDNGIPLHNSSVHEVLKPVALAKRKYLANFLGRAQGKAGRLKIVELGKQFPEQLDAPTLQLTGPMKLGQKAYLERLKDAKFCLAPRGESSWTLRFYESFFVECVPVILSDQIELPFQNVLDYASFSIKWPATRIDESLLQYLASIPDTEIERLLRRGRQVRCLWVYGPDSEPCTAMTGILWELEQKVRLFQQSAETFWLHNGSVVDRHLRPMRDWEFPLPLP